MKSLSPCAPYTKNTWTSFGHQTREVIDAGLGHQGTLGRMTMKSTRKVQGHSLVRSLVHSQCLLMRLLRNARFARALRLAHLFARSPAPERMRKKLSMN